MRKRNLFSLLISLFILLAFSSVFLFYRIKQKSPEYNDELLKDVGTNYIIPLPSDPIIMLIGANNERIIYDIRGYFATKPEMRGKLLSGKFVIKDDPERREIDILIGAMDGNLTYGIYEETFDGSVTWKATSTEVIQKLIKPNTPVLIRVDLEITEDVQIRKYVKEREEILDILIGEFQSNEFNYEFPSDFVLIATALAVVK